MNNCVGCGDTEDPIVEDRLCQSCAEHTHTAYKEVDRGDFRRIKPNYGGPFKTVVCIGCGADKFIVADTGGYLGAIKCQTCGWERTFYSG